MFEWSHESHFWVLFSKFLKNGKKIFYDFDIKGSPLWKKNRKYQKKFFFWKKSYFFFLNLYCTCSKLSFDVYNSHVSKNFKFWHIFAWKFSFFTMIFQQPACVTGLSMTFLVKTEKRNCLDFEKAALYISMERFFCSNWKRKNKKRKSTKHTILAWIWYPSVL